MRHDDLKHTNARERKSRRKALKLARQRTPYDQLPEDVRKIIDLARRTLAEGLSKADGIPFETCLNGIIAGHEAGWLKLEFDTDTNLLVLKPSFPDGRVLEGNYDFPAAIRLFEEDRS